MSYINKSVQSYLFNQYALRKMLQNMHRRGLSIPDDLKEMANWTPDMRINKPDIPCLQLTTEEKWQISRINTSLALNEPIDVRHDKIGQLTRDELDIDDVLKASREAANNPTPAVNVIDHETRNTIGTAYVTWNDPVTESNDPLIILDSKTSQMLRSTAAQQTLKKFKRTQALRTTVKEPDSPDALEEKERIRQSWTATQSTMTFDDTPETRTELLEEFKGNPVLEALINKTPDEEALVTEFNQHVEANNNIETGIIEDTRKKVV